MIERVSSGSSASFLTKEGTTVTKVTEYTVLAKIKFIIDPIGNKFLFHFRIEITQNAFFCIIT